MQMYYHLSNSYIKTISLLHQHTTSCTMRILVLLTVAALAAATVKDKTIAEGVTEVEEFTENALEEAASNNDPVVTRLINKLTCMKKRMNVVRACNRMLETVSDCAVFSKFLVFLIQLKFHIIIT